jgi:hypothetical protein
MSTNDPDENEVEEGDAEESDSGESDSGEGASDDGAFSGEAARIRDRNDQPQRSLEIKPRPSEEKSIGERRKDKNDLPQR